MSGQNRVTVVLDAQDNLSGVLKGISRSTQGLGAGAVLVGNLYTKAFEAAASAVGTLTNRFSEAADMQTSVIGLAGQFSAMTGKSYGDAGVMIKGLNAQFSDMAAKLPGATQDYKNLGLAISDTLIKANTTNGIFDEAAFTKQTMSLTQSLGLLKATNKELTTTDIQLYFTKFAEGASESELSILKLNERMPGLMGELQKASKQLYGDSANLEKLTLAQRTKVMEVATKGLAPPQMIKDLEATASSQIESFKTTLFDQDTGIFGFLRSVTTVNGKSKTVMDGFASLLGEIFGENGLLAAGGKVLNAMGLKGSDPMLALYNGLMTLTGWAKKAGDFMRGLTLPNPKKLSFDRLKEIGGNLGQWVGGQMSSLFQSLRAVTGNMLANGGFAKIGATLAAAFNGLVSYAIGVINSTDWGAVVGTIANVVVGIITALVSFITSIDWGAIVKLLGSVLLRFLTAVGQFVAQLVGGLAAQAATVVSSIAKWIGAKVQGVWDALQSALGRWFTEAKAAISNFVMGSGQPTPSSIGGSLQPATTSGATTNHATGLNVAGLMEAVSRELSAMPSNAAPVVANSSEVILNRGQQADLVALAGSRKPIERRDVVSLVASPKSKDKGVFAPQITVNGTPEMNVQALADEVMSRISQQWHEYQQGAF